MGTKVDIPNPHHLETLVLQVEQIGESWQIFVNGGLVAENIDPNLDSTEGTNALRISRKSKVYIHPKFLKLGSNEFIFHVYGRYPIAPEINPNLMLGLGKYNYSLESLNSNYYARFRPNHVAIPVFILAGLFFLVLFAIRPEYSYFAYMGLFHIAAAIYTTTRQGLLDPYFMDRSILIRVEFFLSLTTIFPLLLLAVHYYFYRKETLRPLYKALVGLNLSIFIVFLVLDLYLCQVLIRLWQYVVPINALAIFLILARAMLEKREDSILLSLTLFSGSLLAGIDIIEAILALPFAHWSYLGMFFVTISFMVIITNNILRQFKNTKRLNWALNQEKVAISRFVPSNFLNYLNKKSIVEIELGDQTNHSMAILFADIRNFTVLSEDMSPQENFNFLNSYLKRVGPVIRKHHGFIDKYIGDGIMALFPESPQDALYAAMEIQEVVTRYNLDRQTRGYQPVTVGIGIHHGDLMLGTIGEAQRMEGTVISDSVNTAARLESLTKTFDSTIIISDTVLQHVDIQKTIDMPPW